MAKTHFSDPDTINFKKTSFDLVVFMLKYSCDIHSYMKKFLFCFFLLFLTQLNYAQVKFDFNLGLQMGNTTYNPNYPYFTTFKSGFFIGAGLVKELNETIAIKADIQFSQKGHKITGTKTIGFGLIETVPASRRYIEFLPHLERKVFDKLVLFVGPGFGFKVMEKFNDRSVNQLLNRNDIFFHGGLHYYLDKTYLILSLKRSFTESDGNVYTTEEGNPILNLNSRNINVLFGMGFRL